MIKFTKMSAAAILIAGAAMMSSCIKNDDSKQKYTDYTYAFEINSADLNSKGYWIDVYNSEYGVLGVNPGLYLSHAASGENAPDKWWTGFCPSRSNDREDHAGDWADNCWGNITGAGAATWDYLLCRWDKNESLTSIPQNPSVCMSFSYVCYPQTIYVANNNWAYWVMKNSFSAADWMKVTFIGVMDGRETGRAECYLAKDGTVADRWTRVELTPLQGCRVIYMQMESSRADVPPMFCVDELAVRLPYN